MWGRAIVCVWGDSVNNGAGCDPQSRLRLLFLFLPLCFPTTPTSPCLRHLLPLFWIPLSLSPTSLSTHLPALFAYPSPPPPFPAPPLLPPYPRLLPTLHALLFPSLPSTPLPSTHPHPRLLLGLPSPTLPLQRPTCCLAAACAPASTARCRSSRRLPLRMNPCTACGWQQGSARRRRCATWHGRGRSGRPSTRAQT